MVGIIVITKFLYIKSYKNANNYEFGSNLVGYNKNVSCNCIISFNSFYDKANVLFNT